MSPVPHQFTRAHLDALRTVTQEWSDRQPILIGAAALALQYPREGRQTRDIDFVLRMAIDAIPAMADKLDGWTCSDGHEQRLIAPGGIEVDLLPASQDLLDAGEITWPRSGQTMNVKGLRLAFIDPLRLELAPELTVSVARVEPIVILKMMAWLDRPNPDREKDLLDIEWVLGLYPDPAKAIPEAWFTSVVFELLDGDPFRAGALLLGLEIARIADAQELDAVRVFLAKALDPEDPDYTQQRFLKVGVPRRDLVVERLEALRLGLDHGGVE